MDASSHKDGTHACKQPHRAWSLHASSRKHGTPLVGHSRPAMPDQTYTASWLHTYLTAPPRAATVPARRVVERTPRAESEEEEEEEEEEEADKASGKRAELEALSDGVRARSSCVASFSLEHTSISRDYSTLPNLYKPRPHTSLLLVRSKTRGEGVASASPQGTRRVKPAGVRVSPSLPWLGRVLVARL